MQAVKDNQTSSQYYTPEKLNVSCATGRLSLRDSACEIQIQLFATKLPSGLPQHALLLLFFHILDKTENWFRTSPQAFLTSDSHYKTSFSLISILLSASSGVQLLS